MKFIKSNFAKKLIIILVVLMVFNIAVPKEVKAWDIAGILFKPISAILVGILTTIDVTIGLTLNGISAATNVIGAISESLSGDQNAALQQADSAISKIFVGPDTIFSGQVAMLDANIFDVVELKDSDIVEGLGQQLSPRWRYGY